MPFPPSLRSPTACSKVTESRCCSSTTSRSRRLSKRARCAAIRSFAGTGECPHHTSLLRGSRLCEFWIVSEVCLFTPAHITVLRRFVDAGGHPAFLRRQPNSDGTPHFMVRDAESWLESLPPEPPPPDVANNLRQEDMVDALRRSNAELVACVRGQPTSQTSRRLLSLTIEPSGRVSSASLVSGVPTAPEAAACLKELGRALQFPARAIPRTTVAFPISF